MFKKLKELETKSKDLQKDIKELEEKITAREKDRDKQTVNKIIKNEYLKEIIKLTESNNYSNTEVILRKIRELAETAIKS